MRLLVRNIGCIVGIEREGRLRLCGAEMDRMETLGDAWLLADGGRIAAFGRSGGEEGIAADRVVDAGGGMLFPSFCDSHTHLVYAGSRDFGSVSVGKVASFFLTRPMPSVEFFTYAYRTPLIERVFLRGEEFGGAA